MSVLRPEQAERVIQYVGTELDPPKIVYIYYKK